MSLNVYIYIEDTHVVCAQRILMWHAYGRRHQQINVAHAWRCADCRAAIHKAAIKASAVLPARHTR